MLQNITITWIKLLPSSCVLYYCNSELPHDPPNGIRIIFPWASLDHVIRQPENHMLKTMHHNKRVDGILFFLVISILCLLNACGKDDGGGISDRLSGPEAVSALPMRVDATVTPTATGTPLEDETTLVQEEMPPAMEDTQDGTAEAEEHEPSELETRLRLLTPTPQELPGQDGSTSPIETPDLAEDTIMPPTPPSSSPTPSPGLTPTLEIEPTAEAELQARPEQSPRVLEQRDQKAFQENQEDNLEDVQEDSHPPVKVNEEQTSPPPKKAEKELRRKSNSQAISTISLDELIVCSALSNRTPSGGAAQFSLSNVKRVYTWMRISGATPPIRLKHLYYLEGKFVTSVTLTIKYPSMRTWSQKTL